MNNGSSIIPNFPPRPGSGGLYVDKEITAIITTIATFWIALILSTSGSVANIINIIVFIKMGFKETINTSLLVLAISDFGISFLAIPASICYSPWLMNNREFNIDLGQVMSVLMGWPRRCLIKVSAFATVLIALERCLCVIMPLKVKSIITHNVVVIYLILTFPVAFGYHAMILINASLGWRFDPRFNKTMFGLIEKKALLEYIFSTLNAVISYTTLFIVMVCTIFLVVTLKRKAIWRKMAASNADDSKERRVVKMVIFIASFFIFSTVINSITQVANTVFPHFSMTGRYARLFFCVLGFNLDVELFNAGVNIFIYYMNSSVYKRTFDALFNIQKPIDMK